KHHSCVASPASSRLLLIHPAFVLAELLRELNGGDVPRVRGGGVLSRWGVKWRHENAEAHASHSDLPKGQATAPGRWTSRALGVDDDWRADIGPVPQPLAVAEAQAQAAVPADATEVAAPVVAVPAGAGGREAAGGQDC